MAFELGNAPVQEWVNQELDGYSADAQLPAYRASISVAVKADAMNLAYRHTNIVVPAATMPEEVHESLSSIDFHQSVRELEEIVGSARARGDGTVRSNIEPSVWSVVEFENDFKITDMWKEISGAQIAGVLDAVRNTALRFSLEIEQFEQANQLRAETRQESITNIFQTVVQGGVVSIAGRADHVIQVGQINVQEGNLNSLIETLRGIGIDEGDLRELTAAIDDDPGATDGPGGEVWAWLKRTGAKVAGAAGDVGVDVTKAAVTAAVLRYFGLG